MRSRQPFHIEDLAVRGLPPMKLFAIPGSNPAILDPNIQQDLPFGNPGASTQGQTQGQGKRTLREEPIVGTIRVHTGSTSL